MPDPMIEFRDVTKRYGTLVANDHLSLAIARGELMTLLGPRMRQDTALRCLTGQSPRRGPDLSGRQGCDRCPDAPARAGMVFQNFALFPT